VQQDRNKNDHLENLEGEGNRQTQERIGEEQDRGSLVIGKMIEVGRGSTNPESTGDELERNVKGEGRIEKSKSGRGLNRSGSTTSKILRQVQLGEERS